MGGLRPTALASTKLRAGLQCLSNGGPHSLLGAGDYILRTVLQLQDAAVPWCKKKHQGWLATSPLGFLWDWPTSNVDYSDCLHQYVPPAL